MTKFTVDRYQVDVDVAELLQEYDWHRAKWKSDRLIAASPFRDEQHPSFFVKFDNGAWGDSGAHDENFASGNFAKLLAFLRNETYQEALDYLVDTYGVRELKLGETIKVPKIQLAPPERRIVMPEGFLTPYKYRNGYLAGRGIPENIQRFMGVGYSADDQAVTLPWRHPDGSLANVKYRQIHGKTFWYSEDGAPIGQLVYGIDKVYEKDFREVVVVEAEIDALSWMACGVPAIALGGTAVTDKQIDLIKRSPIEKMWKAMDNDKAGQKMSRLIDSKLLGYVSLEDIRIPSQYKDANDALKDGANLASLL